MKLLHTSDWHVGKPLRGMSRLDEHRAVLGEIADLAAEEQVDLVLVTGDLFESAAPTPDTQAVVWEALLRLRNSGARVVAIGGNHDNQAGFDAWGSVFAAAGITLVSQRFAVRTEQLLELDAAQTAGLYAERMRLIIAALCEGFERDAVNLLAAHCFVFGGKLGGGEREAQTIFDYSIEAQHLPTNASYVALGHLHRMQRITAAAPAYYAGSPIQVDFGEEHDTKQVLIVEAEPGVPARVTPHVLQNGWSLRTMQGTLAELERQAADAGDAWLRVIVKERSRAGLADDVRAVLPRALDVRIDSPTPVDGVRERPSTQGRSPQELFGNYLELQGIEDPKVERLFARLYEEELHGVDA
jgi:exonuclease SbcD